MATTLRIREIFGRWEALTRDVIPTTITPASLRTPEDVERALARMVEVGWLPAGTTWEVER